MYYSMAEMSVAEMSVGRNVRGRNVRGRNVLAETSVAEMSVAEVSEHRMCIRGRGVFLFISTADCVVETFTIHSYKGQVRKAYSLHDNDIRFV